MKTREDKPKNRYSQFFTDPLIADFMVNEVRHEGAGTFLDPAVGRGAFTCAAHRSMDVSISACEIDPSMVRNFCLSNDYDADLVCDDYLLHLYKERFDCIVCNPPYNRFQDIENRKKYRDLFKERYAVNMSGYSNLCVYFLIKSMNELSESGRCCYIIPYEFLNTGYGEVIKEYLLRSGMLEKIIKFDFRSKIFSDAITTSCILVLENRPHDKVDLITVKDVSELKKGRFENVRTYDYGNLKPEEKWLSYFGENKKADGLKNIVKLSDFGKVSRGIATGANDFFLLSRSDIEERGLSREACVLCLTRSPDVKDAVVTGGTMQDLIDANKKVFVFDGTLAVNQEDLDYIEYGEKRGYNKKYLTGKRSPWYSIEHRETAPILITVFNRNEIKIIRNEAGVKNLTAFHGIYLKDKDAAFADIFFCYLITPLARELLYGSRREYGEGLYMFEPGDLTGADMLDLNLISDDDRNDILDIYDMIKKENSIQKADELDRIFRKYV